MFGSKATSAGVHAAARAVLGFAAILGASPLIAQERTVTFDVQEFEVAGNTLLSAGEVEEVVYPYMGPGKTPEDIEAARAALQAAYEKRGYATVSVYIPEQSVDSGVIRLDVNPQAIGQVAVEGGSRTSRDWVLSRAPSIRPGEVPNFTQVQRDIVALNRSADRTVTPEIKAGEAPGTIDVALKVEDRPPLHGSIELNNFASGQTSALRVAASLRYDDLWGRGDSVSISTQLAPERTDDGAVVSANYLTRLGDVQLLVYGVHSESDIAIIGGINVIGSGDIVGGRLIVPLGQGEGFYHAATLGLDYKDFNENLLLGADIDTAPIAYVPASLNWRGDWSGETYRHSLSLTTTLGIRGLGDDIVAFGRKRFQAEPNFFHARLDGSTQQDIRGLQAYVHLSGQWAGEPLISNEQFAIGGMETVRGYFESEALVDYGIAVQTELRSPPLGGWIGGEPDDLRVHVFLDSGTGAIHQALPGQDVRTSLMSTGVGARVRLFKLFTGAVDVAAPLIDGPNKDRGAITTRFRILGEF
jgi:hemolysin activation/secretion protein